VGGWVPEEEGGEVGREVWEERREGIGGMRGNIEGKGRKCGNN